MNLSRALASLLTVLSLTSSCTGATSTVKTVNCDLSSDYGTAAIGQGEDFKICVVPTAGIENSHRVYRFDSLTCTNGSEQRVLIENGVLDAHTTILSDVSKTGTNGIGLEIVAISELFSGGGSNSIQCNGTVEVERLTPCDASTPDVSYTFPTTDYLPLYDHYNGGMRNTLCVLGATSASAELSPDLASTFYYTPIDNFRDGVVAFKNLGSLPVRNVSGRGPTFCEGGIYLQPSDSSGPASGLDITVTATPINESDGVTICAALDKPWMLDGNLADREGNWKELLLAQGFTASDGEWQYGHSSDTIDRYNMITYCKNFRKRCPSVDPDPTVLSQPQSPSEPLFPTQKATMILRL